ncbi:hypothetical protein EVAR_17134_1 [Eumeta japonica]|uniref:Uncharacterized protein n=1 Tax=Eumeta variegata TaxID=151549 RepID=A0A4C1UN67_EUMVA|nr:hypothetical protein EVAR_17134_1 [Eumeta japonica]
MGTKSRAGTEIENRVIPDVGMMTGLDENTVDGIWQDETSRRSSGPTSAREPVTRRRFLITSNLRGFKTARDAAIIKATANDIFRCVQEMDVQLRHKCTRAPPAAAGGKADTRPPLALNSPENARY